MAQPLGPLVPARTNPRYFAVAHAEGVDERLVYLTGSHVNNNFHDGLGFGRDCPEDPERFDLTPTWICSPSVVITSSGSGAGSSFGLPGAG